MRSRDLTGEQLSRLKRATERHLDYYLRAYRRIVEPWKTWGLAAPELPWGERGSGARQRGTPGRWGSHSRECVSAETAAAAAL